MKKLPIKPSAAPICHILSPLIPSAAKKLSIDFPKNKPTTQPAKAPKSVDKIQAKNIIPVKANDTPKNFPKFSIKTIIKNVTIIIQPAQITTVNKYCQYCNIFLTGQSTFFKLYYYYKTTIIMKNIMFMIIATLGVVMMSTSCGSYTYANGSYAGYGPQYVYQQGTVRTTPSPDGLFVRSNNMRPTGTYVVGNRSYPYQLHWSNMSIVKNGLMVYVYNGSGQLINQYDLRIPKQDIEDVYQPTGMNGKALSVEVCIRGGNGFNAIIVSDGNNRETYYLRN